MGRGNGRRGPPRRPSGGKKSDEPEFRNSDVFEAEDIDAQEDKEAGKRYDVSSTPKTTMMHTILIY